MSRLTVTSKGQVTLRKDLLQHLGVRPGEQIEVVELPGGELRIRATRPTGRIEDFFGSLKSHRGKPVSIEEMNEIIAKGWAGEL
ncbi:AbrB/MazE/SpoVT family DNA-binding domain-containing protein [Sphingomonas sp. LB-2]|uniref:AbrB/MazE/SpoVT family DNA-binding domain-containing protein n=1 Tax=Sphingomonas caeni TaxID=2984949 RepID=UPI00222F8AF5|nr:AbrB/MazE/SpoVT family DNA-binding domain-containing protein [Sphingomonas caeni]MCW3847613.1 AbrB/MazE/SpoVT family DNA-binding domain-containing protein [Sphingomonas caeni]